MNEEGYCGRIYARVKCCANVDFVLKHFNLAHRDPSYKRFTEGNHDVSLGEGKLITQYEVGREHLVPSMNTITFSCSQVIFLKHCEFIKGEM